MSDYDFDVVVVGGGPGGYVAAIRAAQLGLRTAVAEKDSFGGVCLNRGCIPTKSFLRSVEALAEVQKAESCGVVGYRGGTNATLDQALVKNRKDKIRSMLVKGVEGLMKKNGVTVFRAEAVCIDAHTVDMGDKQVTAGNLIIATGSRVKMLPGDVVKTDRFFTSDSVLDIEELPQEIVIIGGGVIGIEFAYFFSGAGTKVTIIEFLDRILPPVDAEIAAMVHTDFEKRGITIHTGARVTTVTDGNVTFEKNGDVLTLDTQCVLLAAGREPYVSDDVLALGVECERGAVVTDSRMRTSVEGVYAIGDVNGKLMLAHTASAEGIVAAENIAGITSEMDYRHIPSAVYTKPEVASCGLTEEDAVSKYGSDRVTVGIFPMIANGKSKVEGDERGIVKVVAGEEYGEIFGVHLYCLHATDMIAEAAVAMRCEATVEDLVHTIHPHPTVSEAVQEAFHAVAGGAIHC